MINSVVYIKGSMHNNTHQTSRTKIIDNIATSLIASATQHLIRSSYKSADRCISGASGQCSSINNAYSTHLQKGDKKVSREIENRRLHHNIAEKTGIPSTEYRTTVILRTISYAGKHTGSFAVTQHLQIRKLTSKAEKSKEKGK